jgi:hypothetical protein
LFLVFVVFDSFLYKKIMNHNITVYGRRRPFWTRTVPLRFQNEKKTDGCQDPMAFTAVKLTAVPVIRAVRSPSGVLVKVVVVAVLLLPLWPYS